jgi:hypothetical protein
MGSKYHPVGDEKFDDLLPERTSTSESLGSTLLEDEDDSHRLSKSRLSVKWMWLAHVFLLSLSFGLFAAAYFVRGSTLKFVQEFSAYCEWNLSR